MKRKANKTKYNRNLFVVLITVTVIVCAVAAAVVLSKDNGSSLKDKNTPSETVSDNNNSVKTVSPEVKEEIPKVSAPVEDEKDDLAIEPEITEPEPVTSDDDWMLVLANPWNKLPEDFSVELTYIDSVHRVDSRIVSDLNAMMSDLASAGHSAFVCSSYRTNSKQTTLYNNEVADYRNRGYSEEDAAIEAAKWVAIPGTSEHQTGLAVDIMSSHYLVLDEGQEDTAEQQSKGDVEDGDRDREQNSQQDMNRDVQPEQDGHGVAHDALRNGDGKDGQGIAQDEVGGGQRRGIQPLEQ